jgi:hypothetical protein
MWVLRPPSSVHYFSTLTYSQAAVAKAYQSTAAAAAMENAVQQTSRFVSAASPRDRVYTYSSHHFSVFYFVPLAALVAYFAWRFYY